MATRQRFTKEFKEAAIRRVELGGSVAEVARGCEVSPNVLHRWRRRAAEIGHASIHRDGTTEG